MYVNIKKIMLGITLLVVGVIGCGSTTKSVNNTYLRCNETSNGKMAEIENGYFIVFNSFLHYADKNNLEKWVVVCNKPDCMHEDYTCNGYLQSCTKIWQKNDKLYEMQFGNLSEKPYIFEIATDGSGLKKVYEIPIENEINPTGYAKATFQDEFLLEYGYLDERGIYQKYINCLEEDETGDINVNTLYKSANERASLLLSGNEYWNIRGENLIITSLYLNEGSIALNNLCKIDNEKIVPLNLPNNINFENGYLDEDIFTYYQPQEGFYKYNINTGEQELIFENHLGDGKGYILSNNCIIECNRYLTYIPEKPCLKFYDGEEWIDVNLPQEISNCDDPFYPICIASDRIFFRMNVIEDGQSIATSTHLYYMMLDEEKHELVYAGKIGVENEEEISSEEENDIFENFEEITVFDTEEYFFKITDIYLDYSNRCCIEMFYENRSDENKYLIVGEYATINGIQCNTSWGTVKALEAQESKTYTLCFIDDMVDTSKVSEFYEVDEYTDIEIVFRVIKTAGEPIDEQIVHIYPHGKEKASIFTRESQNTDIVLVNDENVSVIVTGYEEYFVPGDTMNIFIKNKTNQAIQIKVEEAFANDIAVDTNNYFGVYWLIVNPGAVAMYPMTLFDGVPLVGPFNLKPNSAFFTSNNITAIEKIEMKLKISEYFYGSGCGEELVYKTFILNP